MAKLLSVAKTIVPVRDGFPVEEIFGLGWRLEYSNHLKAGGERYAIRDGRLYKDVTRRGGWSKKKGETAAWKPGWPNAKLGDVVELVEWSPRVGDRWVCRCGWLGATSYASDTEHECQLRWEPGGPTSFRSPRRFGLRRFAEVDLVRLGDITPEDVIREGFPGLTPAQFVDFYCSGKPEPDRMVTRLVLEVVS